MIPVIAHTNSRPRWERLQAGALTILVAVAATVSAAPPAGTAPPSAAGTPGSGAAPDCLESGDGYFRARVAGAIDAKIDWPNSGTKCQGETKSAPPGVRMSFQRSDKAKPDLLFVFGLTGVREGQPAHAAGANLTLIVQGTPKIFGTLGDSRCTVDSLTQRRLRTPGAYRIEARGFCTQPARAVRGTDDVLVRTFEFAGLVNYGTAAGAGAAATAAQLSH
jgi:hypothetical protein